MAKPLDYGCPTCRSEGRKVQMTATDRALICSANPNHIWHDTSSFIALKPSIEFRVIQAAAPQNGHVPVTVMIPPRVENDLKNKWGDRYAPTVAGVLEMVAEGEVMVIPEEIIKKLSGGEFLGARPGSAAELSGMVYALRQEAREEKQRAENVAKDVAAYEAHSPGRVLIDCGDWHQLAVEKARDAGIPLKLWLERNLATAVKESWF
jgi:hypothetical protein